MVAMAQNEWDPYMSRFARFLWLALLLGCAGGVIGRAALAAHTHTLQIRTIAVLKTDRRPEPILADPARHHIYVGNESGGTVSVIDDRTNRIVKKITAGHEIEDL